MAHGQYNGTEVRFNNSSVHYSRTRLDSDDSSLEGVPTAMAEQEGYTTDESDYLVPPRRKKRGIWKYLPRCLQDIRCCSCCEAPCRRCNKPKEYKPRTIFIGKPLPRDAKYPANIIRNQKYSVLTFIPLVLYGQFKYFLNFYFLVMAISQFIPEIRVGQLYTYWAPLSFVIFVTMVREAVDDIRRFRRDWEVNGQKYKRLTAQGFKTITSSKIRVGDIIVVEKNQRVPADMVLLKTTEKSGACFIRTDQLDGETDWKLRLAVPTTQSLLSDLEMLELDAQVYAERPQLDIHSFIGTFAKTDNTAATSLDIENTLWTNTVVASGTAVGLVVYTGRETRSAMNTSKPQMKVGLLDMEINTLTKLLFFMVLVLSLIMMILKGFSGPWYRYFFRFVVLFSYIIPISLRVNLDMGKVVYSWFMQRDANISGTVVRSTTIPEELGRIQYLLTDKTGTLTQNEMIFKKLHLGTVSFTAETMDEVTAQIRLAYAPAEKKEDTTSSGGARSGTTPRVKRTVVTRTFEAVKALALCHNVTPVFEDVTESGAGASDTVSYQASSPDEVALVSWTETVGLTLVRRDLSSMTLRTPQGALLHYQILQIFPFTSESKRMGIIVREETNEITFYMKGADVVMQTIVHYNDWLEEETGNMAREGLRTLVVAKKTLTEEVYQDFESRYEQAKLAVTERTTRVAAVVESLERDMQLLCLTGVEDKLQENVRPTLELLRNAGIKIWMLTGDKLETATCIAKSSRLVSRTQSIHTFSAVNGRTDAHLELNAFRRKTDCALVIRGDSLDVCLKYYEHEFVEVACQCPAVVVCRCSPTQKAKIVSLLKEHTVVCLKYYEHEFVDLACQCPAVVVCRCSPTQKAKIVSLLKEHTEKQTCAIGDGGNDVSMIQAAHAGVGIVGKEGRQASLAADFSITQFSHLGRLLVVHGRNSYKRSAALAQFVIHRGLIITTMQAVFSSIFYFASVALFPGFLLVGYATVFTMFPVFSIVLDKDVSAEIAMTYPELYKELMKGRSFNFKTFFLWVLISIYQGGIIMYGSLLLFEDDFIHVVSITFTALILTELLMVTLTIRTWHWLMLVSQLVSLAFYIIALAVFRDFFDKDFLRSWDFVWKVLVTTSISCIPLFILKYLRQKFAPSSYSKLT